MWRRRIHEAEVEEALSARDATYASQHGDDRVVVLGETLFGRRLKVVVRAADEEYVVTVMDRDRQE